MLGLFKKKKSPDNDNISSELFKKEVNELKVRLDLAEDDIKRLRKKAKIPKSTQDEETLKAIEDDGFGEIRALNAKFGKNEDVL